MGREEEQNGVKQLFMWRWTPCLDVGVCAIVVVQSTVDRGRLNIPGSVKREDNQEKSPELQSAVRPAVPDVLWPEAC